MSLKEDFIGQNVDKQSWLPTNFFFKSQNMQMDNEKKCKIKFKKKPWHSPICIFWDFKRKFGGQPTLLLNIFPIKSSFSDISYPTWIDSEKFIENAYKTSCLKTEGTYLSQELLKSKQEFFLSMPAAALWRMINWMMRTLLLMSFRYPQQT